MRDKSKTIKFISALLIILIIMPAVLLSKPKQAEAFSWSTWATDIKTFFIAESSASGSIAGKASLAVQLRNVAKEVGKQVLQQIARKVLQDMTKSTINWINTGNWGNPFFVQNPQSFFKDIVKLEVKNVVDTFGYDSSRFPFGKDFALNVISSYNRQIEDNAAYSLSKVFNDPVLERNYRNDFNVGGWNGFLINTQYPQNNYIGFQMIATEHLASRLEGMAQNKIQEVQKTLDQGMGFLSPKTCPSNPKYNNLKNEFQQPSFDPSTVKWDPPEVPLIVAQVEAGNTEGMAHTSEEEYARIKAEYLAESTAYKDEYDSELAIKKGEWAETSTCPGGLVATTPGAVVGNQIMKAMVGPYDQTSLAAAMGNSISAITNSLLSKFMGKGLNALTSKVSKPEEPDNWDYYGGRLGSPAIAGSSWDSGPDQELILDKFKKAINGETKRIAKAGEIISGTNGGPDTIAVGGETISEVGNTGNGTYIPGDIANTERELLLIYNEDESNPGISQMFGNIWPKTRELDICLPGPDINWQERMEKEMNRNSKTLQEKINEDDADKSVRADFVLKEFMFAVDFFEDWINNKMMKELPSSILYMDAVDEIETLYQESEELTDARRLKMQALGRLEAVKNGLDSLIKQPEPDSADEKIMIKLKQQYDATRDTIANTVSVGERQNQLEVAIDKYKKLTELIPQCEAERVVKGWTLPDPDYKRDARNTSFSGSGATTSGGGGAPTRPATWIWTDRGGPAFQSQKCPSINPQEYFNSLIADKNPVNWLQILGEIEPQLWACGIGQQRDSNGIPRARLFLPTAACPDASPPPGDDNARRLGVRQEKACWDSHMVDIVDDGIPDSAGGGGSGTEQALFCTLPVKGGYTHNSFIGPDTTRPKLPMVNGTNVLSWTRWWGLSLKRVNIEMNCDIIYKANVLDYKKNLPGLTTIYDEFEDITIDPGGQSGGQCDDVGVYAGDLREAMDAVLSANPDVANSPNTVANDRAFLALVESELISMGFNARDEVLNGNNNPSTGDIIALWMEDDSTMERYDAIIDGGSGSRSIASAISTQFTGAIPLDCFSGGGGNECGCPTDGGGETETPTEPIPTEPGTTTPGSPNITSVSPTSVIAGQTTITIRGTDLVSTVQFFDAVGGINTVVGTVNSAGTQVTVTVPSDIPAGGAAVRVRKSADSFSNTMQLTVAGTGSGTTTAAPSIDATAGWGGSLAYNPSKNNWLVVSTLNQVSGRIIGNDRVPVTPEFKINTEINGMAAKVAFAPDLNKYLVVYIGFPEAVGGTIYGRFVNPDGTLSGNVFVIFKDPPGGASFLSKTSMLQYDSKNKKFAFVWEYRHPGVDSNLITISQSGIPGAVVDVGTDTGVGAWAPVLAVNEDSNEYCLAYVKGDGQTNVVKKYNVATGVLSPETTFNNGDLGVTGMVYNSVNKKYLIGWGTTNFISKGKILNSCNINDGGSVITLNSAGSGPSLAYNPKSNNYAAIVQNQNDFGNTYTILNSSGSVVKTGLAFDGSRNGKGGNFSPVLAPNLNDGTFGAISAIDYATTRFTSNLGTATASTSTSGGITVATPSSTWTPAQTNNGWWPKISPDGRYVTYGNWGESWVTDLNTGQNYDFKAPSGMPAGSRCVAGHWITGTKLTFICETGPTAAPTGMIRYEATVGEWVARQTADNPALVWATLFVAKDGHWGSYLAANPRRIAKDNVVLTTNGPGGALSMSGNTLVHACDGSDNPNICVWNGSTLSKTIVARGPASETSVNNGYILYAGGGKSMRGVDPNGIDADKRIGTFSFEGKPVVFLVKGAPWIASSVENTATNKSFVMLRPWNSKSVIVLDTGTPDSGSAGIDAVFDGTNFVVAQHTNRGILKVLKVPENAARSQF